MGRTADPQDELGPDYVKETVAIGKRYLLWHEMAEAGRTRDPAGLRELWKVAGERVEREAVQELHKKMKENHND